MPSNVPLEAERLEDIPKRAENAAVLARLQSFDRSIFLEELGKMLASGPSEADVRAFARRNPEKWASACATLAKLGGFSEKQEVALTVIGQAHLLSDRQLVERAEEIEKRLLVLSQGTDGSYSIDEGARGEGENHTLDILPTSLSLELEGGKEEHGPDESTE